MSLGKGYMSIGALIKGVTWGTAVECGALSGFEFLRENIQERVALLPDEEVRANAFRRAGDKGSEAYTGSVDMNFRYRGLDLWLALAFGECSTSQVSGTVYKHVLKPANTREGQFATLVLQKTVDLEEYTSIKVTGFHLKVSQGGKAEVTFDLVAHGLNRNTDTGTNDATTFASVTVPTTRDVALFSQMTAWINAYDGADFDDDVDTVYINAFALDVTQPFVEDDYSTWGGTKIEEPTADGKFDVKLKFDWRKYSDAAGGNSALVAAAQTKGKYKAKVQLTGAYNITGAYYHDLTMYFPELQIPEQDHSIPGANVIPTSISFDAVEAESAPTGFSTGYTEPIIAELQNELTTSPIA